GPTDLVGWSADNSLFAAGTAQTFVWNASTHQLLHTLPAYNPVGGNGANWAPASSRLAASGAATLPDGSSFSGDAFIVWNATTGQQLTSYIHSSPLVLAWSPNGKYIASAYDGDNGVYIWKAS
ncbi:MAG TPA: hypothetical protein VH593_15735, partial [Ktedonobacteraceae bacterium]